MAGLDEAAIREFLATTYPRLVAGLTLVCGSRAAAEDAVQEALARAWERAGRGVHIDSIPAWVTTVALNQTRSWLRRVRSERKARGALDAPDPPEPTTDRLDIARALAALPRGQREATVLRYYLDLDVAEVGTVMGVSEGTAKTQLHRARKALAQALGEHDLEEADHESR